MYAAIEWIHGEAIGELRLFKDGDSYGDSYIWCCVIVRDGDSAEIRLTLDAPPLKGIPEIQKEMNKWGIFRVWWRRFNPKTKKERIVEFIRKG